MSKDIEIDQIEMGRRLAVDAKWHAMLDVFRDQRITYLQLKHIKKERLYKSTLFIGYEAEELYVMEIGSDEEYAIRAARRGDYRRHKEDGFLDLNGEIYPLDELDEENLNKIK